MGEAFAIYIVAICAVLNFILSGIVVFVMLGVLDALERLEKLAAGDPDTTESCQLPPPERPAAKELRRERAGAPIMRRQSPPEKGKTL